jgi:hypothetical protein
MNPDTTDGARVSECPGGVKANSRGEENRAIIKTPAGRWILLVILPELDSSCCYIAVTSLKREKEKEYSRFTQQNLLKYGAAT